MMNWPSRSWSRSESLSMANAMVVGAWPLLAAVQLWPGARASETATTLKPLGTDTAIAPDGLLPRVHGDVHVRRDADSKAGWRHRDRPGLPGDGMGTTRNASLNTPGTTVTRARPRRVIRRPGPPSCCGLPASWSGPGARFGGPGKARRAVDWATDGQCGPGCVPLLPCGAVLPLAAVLPCVPRAAALTAPPWLLFGPPTAA